MKNLLKVNSLFLIATLSFSVYASTTLQATSNKPCKAIKIACIQAGYVKGDKQGKGLRKNCIRPILSGQLVNGVTVAPQNISACKEKIAAKIQQKAITTIPNNNSMSDNPESAISDQTVP